MRGFDLVIATLILRVLPPRPPTHERRLVPAVDDADRALLDRDTLNRQRAALIASLWPEARPCVVPAVFEQLPAPALLAPVMRVSWRAARRDPNARSTPVRLPLENGEVRVAQAA